MSRRPLCQKVHCMSQLKAKATVFAYHSVGVRAIRTLLARGIEIGLVVTHQDNPQETIWFESVAALCEEFGIPTITPDDPNATEVIAKIRASTPDFIFSFYYRHMLCAEILSIAPRGAYNLHGSLLPHYRGRVPVNWAVLHGESETGVTLHEMTIKPDAGAILAQTAVPILPDDTAFEVFGKLTVATEQTLWTCLPKLLAGSLDRKINDLSQGSYFGGRKPEDGRIDWNLPAQQVYNLHRAVAPPYPGAFAEQNGRVYTLAKARLATDFPANLPRGISVVDNVGFGVCGDGRALRIIELLFEGKVMDMATLQQHFASR